MFNNNYFCKNFKQNCLLLIHSYIMNKKYYIYINLFREFQSHFRLSTQLEKKDVRIILDLKKNRIKHYFSKRFLNICLSEDYDY